MTSKEAGPPSLHPPSESAFATSASSELTTTTITTTHNPTLKDDDLEFLFREEEFEEDSFDAAAFVAKYRRVSSLESLREQLVAYSKHIKSHLYLIINRDYKDFITISTKLDGLDTRLDMIERPLFELQMDLSSLHNGIASSLHSIKDKVEQQQSINRKKTLIKIILECMDNVGIAQTALQLTSSSNSNASPVKPHLDDASSSSSSSSSSSNRRNKLYKNAQLLHGSTSGITTNKSSIVLEKDLFVCSEYERSAAALSIAKSNVEAMLADKDFLEVNHLTSFAPMIKSLSDSVHKTFDNLMHKIQSHLEHYFSKASTTTTNTSSGSTDQTSVETEIELRCFAHCLRALIYINQGHIAEECLARTVLEPYLKTAFTQGKIDGKEGRGSYSGLQETLTQLLAWLQKSSLGAYLSMAEEVVCFASSTHRVDSSNNTSTTDLMVNGVWKPIANVLQEKFTHMFTIGISHVFSLCYRTMIQFVQELPQICEKKYQPHVIQRFQHHAHVVTFLSQFKIDMYYQLRSREIMSRLDKICEHDIKHLTNPSGDNSTHLSMEAVYLPRQKTDKAKTTSISKAEMEQLMTILQKELKCHDSIFAMFMMELLLCIHNEVAILPLQCKMMILSERVILRLVLHLILLTNSYNPSTSSNGNHSTGSVFSPMMNILHGHIPKHEYDTLRVNYFQGSSSAASDAGATPTPVPASPMKSSAANNLPPATPDAKSASAIPSTPATPSMTTNASKSLPQVSTDKLLYLLSDLHQIMQWIQQVYLPKVNALTSSSSNKSIIEKSFNHSIDCLSLLMKSLYQHFTNLIGSECKKPLSSIKAIAGKYRMTNKPAPTSASPYVDTIFAPIKSISTGSYVDMLQQITIALTSTSSQWKKELLINITLAMQEQVTSLLETVKQMDSALQRRAKNRTTANTDATSTTNMSDSEKIFLQVKLDVIAYGEEMKHLGIDPQDISAYVTLLQDVSTQV